MLLPFVRPLAILISLVMLGFGARYLWLWNEGVLILGPDGVWRATRGPFWQLVLGLVLVALAFGGRSIFLLLLPSRGPLPPERAGDESAAIAPDGTRLHLESTGPASAPVIILTHGWGLAARAWAPLRARLADRFRVLSWDLPGLGRSGEPPDGAYSLHGFAQALGRVVMANGAERVVLVGHSIGGMTSETVWRACPEEVRERVAGLVLVHTTHTNPLRTMWLSPLWLALQKPVIEPMLRLSVVLSPVLWLLNWQSYFSGSLHIATWLVTFGRHATRETVDMAARLQAEGSPRVQAKGNLAMLHWHMREQLKDIPVPTLVIGGRSDIITLPQASAEIEERVPDAELRLVEGVGHLGYLELDAEYADMISEFAARCLRPQAPAAANVTSLPERRAPSSRSPREG